MFEMTGKILSIGEVKTFKNDFTKREFIIDNGNKYQNTVKFELTKENCQLTNGLVEGDEVTVSFWVNGTEWQGNYYVNLSASEIKATQQENTLGQTTKLKDVGADTGGVRVGKPEPQLIPADDDLPF
jgi:hypothetical protein